MLDDSQMLYIYLYIIFSSLFSISLGEWELPEELRPPKKLIERVGGFSPFVGFGDIPRNSLLSAARSFLSESTDIKYFPIVLKDSDEVM